MLLDHPGVVVGRHGCQSLRQQIVVRVARLDFDNIPLFAQVVHRLNQQQLYTTIGTFGQSILPGATSLFLHFYSRHHSTCFRLLRATP
jgi:hypothetical protein